MIDYDIVFRVPMNNMIDMDIPTSTTIMNNRELDSQRFIMPRTCNIINSIQNDRINISDDTLHRSTLDLFNYIFESSSLLSILDNIVDNVTDEVPPMYQEHDPCPDNSPPSFT